MYHYSFKATPEKISVSRICTEAPTDVQALTFTIGKRTFLAFRKDSIIYRAAKMSQLSPYLPTFRASPGSFEIVYDYFGDDWYFVCDPKTIGEMLHQAHSLRANEMTKLRVAVREIAID